MLRSREVRLPAKRHLYDLAVIIIPVIDRDEFRKTRRAGPAADLQHISLPVTHDKIAVARAVIQLHRMKCLPRHLHTVCQLISAQLIRGKMTCRNSRAPVEDVIAVGKDELDFSVHYKCLCAELPAGDKLLNNVVILPREGLRIPDGTRKILRLIYSGDPPASGGIHNFDDQRVFQAFDLLPDILVEVNAAVLRGAYPVLLIALLHQNLVAGKLCGFEGDP